MDHRLGWHMLVKFLSSLLLLIGFAVAQADAVRNIRVRQKLGLLIDIHGQGTSAVTAYRGTSNGLTVTGLRFRSGEAAHSGPESLLGILQRHQWTVHPDPFDGKEQSGFGIPWITGYHHARFFMTLNMSHRGREL